jgi:hypothetical protein
MGAIKQRKRTAMKRSMKTGMTNLLRHPIGRRAFHALLAALACAAAAGSCLAATAPTAFNLSVVTTANVAIPIVLQGSDPNGLPLTFSIVSTPVNGTLSGLAPNLIYTPVQNFVGPDSFAYVVSNGEATSSPATVSIAVKFGLSINNISVTEGSVFPGKVATFTVSKVGFRPFNPVTVSFSTVDGTAKAGSDYYFTGSFLTFAPDVTSQFIKVIVIGDTLFELDETFLVTLFLASANAVIVNGTGRGTILNDDLFVPTRVGTAALTPENSVVDVGEPVNLSLTWTHPVGWRQLDSVDLLIVGDEGESLATRWHEAENSFSLFNPAADSFVRTAGAGSPARFETPEATLHLQESTGGGPPGKTATIDFSLSFKPLAAGRTFSVEAFAIDDSGNQQGYESVGTLTVLPR